MTEKTIQKKNVNKTEVRELLRSPSGTDKPKRSPEEIRKSYEEYRKRKKEIIEFEKTNTRYLVLWPASDKDLNKERQFYNMGGTSAILYVHEIGPRIGRKPTLRHDMDHGNKNEKFLSGVCSIMDVEALTKKLAEIGIERTATKNKDIIMYKLHREFPHSEVRDMLKLEQKRIDALNSVIYSKVLYPDIHKQIIELKRLIPPKVKNMEKTYREVVGMELMKSLMNTIRIYSEIAHGDIDEKEGARGLLKETDMILAEISLMNELQLWEVSFCIRMADIVVGMRNLIKGRIINKNAAG